MSKPALIVSHVVTLLVGAGIAYFAASSRNDGGDSKNSGVGVTTFSGSGSSKSGSSSSTPDPENMSAVSLEQMGYQGGYEDPIAALEAAKDIPGRDNKYIYTESVYTAWGEKDGATLAASRGWRVLALG